MLRSVPLLLAFVTSVCATNLRILGVAAENPKAESGFRSARRCLRSLSRQIPVIQIKLPEEDIVFISKSDRLLE
jgi:hypothetical protein